MLKCGMQQLNGYDTWLAIPMLSEQTFAWTEIYFNIFVPHMLFSQPNMKWGINTFALKYPVCSKTITHSCNISD